ncbi:MAG: hypothetical protein IPL52_07430 [Flavobacteriales bacterium]|nr:hypothetical protein [Flavobacteriales bacterium]
MLVGSCVGAIAQRTPVFQVHHYMPEHGLSNRHITALVQDNIGFVWAGSVSGLDRLDGHGVRNWSVSDGLSGGRVDVLRRDGDGLLWAISTDIANDIKTIDVMDPRAGVLQPFVERFAMLPFDPSQLVRIGPQRADGAIVLGASSPARCIVYHRAGTFKVMPLDGQRFEPLGDDANDKIIGHIIALDGSQRIVRLDAAGKEEVLQRIERGTSVELLVSGRTAKGALYWLRSPDGSKRCYDTYSELVLDLGARGAHASVGDPEYRPVNVTALTRRSMRMVDSRIMNENGELLFDLKDGHPEVGNSIKDCMVDNSGDPWVATEFGLFHIEPRGDAFERLLWTPNIPEGYGVLCRGMAWHDGRLFLSTEWDGARVLSRMGDSVVVERRLDPKHLFATYVDADGTWWRGGPHVVYCEMPDGRTRRYDVPDKVWSILGAVNGGMLLGGLEGLHWLEPGSGRVERWADPGHPELGRAHVLQLEQRENGDLMATTSKGLYRLSADGHVLERWWSRAEHPMKLPYDDLHHCYIDAEGIFWLSTRGAGLVRFDPSNGQEQQYTTRNGFPNNMVYAAYEDTAQQLWLPTDGGIVRFDKRTRQSAVFTSADGITHDEFNRLAHARGDDGRLYFGGMNGITAFDPADFDRERDEVQPPLVLTSFLRYSAEDGGMVDRSAEVARGGAIVLDEQDRSMQISFALLSFEGAGRILYAWRLAGVEDEWNYQKDPFVRLDRLPYGDHVLEVKARDAQGRWCEHELHLPITVRMPWEASRSLWVGVGAFGALFLLTPWLLRRRKRPPQVRVAVA